MMDYMVTLFTTHKWHNVGPPCIWAFPTSGLARAQVASVWLWFEGGGSPAVREMDEKSLVLNVL